VSGAFLDERRLLDGPWPAFERDVARLLVFAGFEDVRIVGGTGDKGADVVGVRDGRIWVVQCKFTSTSLPSKAAAEEVVEASRFYTAQQMAIAISRPASPALKAEIARFERLGFPIRLLTPARLLKTIARAPSFPPSRRTLRDYQQQASEKLYDSLQETGRGQIVLATGLGKTVVMAEVAARLFVSELLPTKRMLVLADKRELVRQLQFGFWNQLPKTVPTHLLTSEEEPAFWEGITFATVQSVYGRLGSLPDFDAVFVDEAHHIGSPTFQAVIERLDPPRLAGVTATPWRGDAYDIDTLLGQPLVRVGISEGLARGFLSEVDYRLLADNLDWEFVQEASVYGYSLSQLNRRLIIPTRDEEAARIIVSAFNSESRRAALVFSPSVEHAKELAATLRLFGLKAEPIDGSLGGRERDKLMANFRKGVINVLCSVDLFNEGVDVPDVDMLVFMRATHSRRIFVQQLGRGLRMSPGKDNVIVLDFVTDLRRVAEVAELERATRENAPLERLPLGPHLIQFANQSAGSMLLEWAKDQADLLLREGDPTLELPQFDYPEPRPPGGVD
jgi:superfamily II DNA or RNA helicase